jgi:hypothetical protein
MHRNIAGQRFGRLLALKPVSSNKYRRWNWEYKCDCGNVVVMDAAQVNSGQTKSCGCFRREHSRDAHTTHGKARTPAHNSWIAMRRRCLDSNNPNYPHYGGRGITICGRWSKFENFLADMGERPAGKTLDRIDNTGNYEPSNCRWATTAEQLRNQQKTLKLEWLGETLCLSEWARRHHLNASAVRDRYHRGDRPPYLFRPPQDPRLNLKPGRKPRRSLL